MYYVYMLTNKTKTVLYTGFTGNLIQRLEQHKALQVEGFTKNYKATILIYYEEYRDVNEAKLRERRLKKWKREWKEELINKSNPDWNEIVLI